MTSDARSDLLAQHAAQLIHDGNADGIADAISRAVLETGWTLVPRPTRFQVRRHVQALAMQSVGQEAYEQRITDLWTVAQQLMTVLEDWSPRLLGRAAQGHIDAGVTIYIRIFTKEKIGAVAQQLVNAGYDEPSFSTADTPHHGRFDRIQFEIDGDPVIITRCAPHHTNLAAIDLFTGKPITSLTLEQLAKKLSNIE